MESDNFEKHIREQLRSREIKPSAGAWAKISQQLETPQKKRPYRFYRYGIAAGLIGLIILSVWYFRTSDNIGLQETEVVESPNKNSGEGQKEGKMYEGAPVQKVEEAIVAVALKKSEKEHRSEPAKKITPEPIPSGKFLAEAPSEVTVTASETILDTAEHIIDLKISEVLARMEAMEQNSYALSDAEVDSLLKDAQMELIADQRLGRDKTIDAMALLTEVEYDLDQSFRDQIFERLKSGFLKVRTAVAQRND
tara:strand:+ start:1427 stop:2182 length:756 start_codon:yes stop_codon:yes gene_type:complete